MSYSYIKWVGFFFFIPLPLLFLEETRPILHVSQWCQAFGGCQYPTLHKSSWISYFHFREKRKKD